jgi:hypothetical protein
MSEEDELLASILELNQVVLAASKQALQDEMASLQHMREQMLKMEYSRVIGIPETVYAEIKVHGRTVATILNSGETTSTDAVKRSIANLLSMHNKELTGPELAKLRAEEIAVRLHGSIVVATTALSQYAWNNIPRPEIITDWDALRRDPRLIGPKAIVRTRAVKSQLSQSA